MQVLEGTSPTARAASQANQEVGAADRQGLKAALSYENSVTGVLHSATGSLPHWRHLPPAGYRHRIGRLHGLSPPRRPKCNKRSPSKHINLQYQHGLGLRGESMVNIKSKLYTYSALAMDLSGTVVPKGSKSRLNGAIIGVYSTPT